MLIQILVDNINSWIIPYANELKKQIEKDFSYKTTLIHNHQDVIRGDVLLLLSCEKIFKSLHLNHYNLVVHESALPEGKGWSPLSWQVLEGKNKIPITLFEATEKVDAGKIYIQDNIELNGDELFNELKQKQGEKTNELILSFLREVKTIKGYNQKGKDSFYPKRTPKDSQLDINEPIESQFNLLRICDNKHYPAFFIKNGIKYYLEIYKERK